MYWGVRNAKLKTFSDEAYAQFSQYRFLSFILLMRVPAITEFVDIFSANAVIAVGSIFGWHLR